MRSHGLTRSDVERALVDERSVVRLWAMRGTIHLVPSEDAAWLVDLLGPLGMTGSQRRLGQLGVAEEDCPRAVALIRDVLADRGPLTRAELMEPLARAGILTGAGATLRASVRPRRLGGLLGLVGAAAARRAGRVGDGRRCRRGG